ncbi:LacI family DNA-binding transcriptional regulator [Pseudovibrio exalbescens]|uniref:LacI family DNA-binding transcriptional regulator n=1 Tax=Pseudovibrio exalbescens TaxID=197461 RepID=UPI000C9A7B7E|nr:LacI family DNA-binding transcriptional regulator [Pseudovibrio exalbescens]
MATMRDVAKAAGVSIATVSAVINKTTKVSAELTQRVNDAIKEVGYRPNGVARSLKMGATPTIACILPGITNPVFAEMAQTIESEANKKGYAVFVCNALEDNALQDKYLQFASSMRPVGGIIIPAAGSEIDVEAIQREIGVPFVVLDRAAPDTKADSIVVDNYDAAFNAVNYLISLGHKRIGAIASFPHSFTSRDRIRGYRSAMEQSGLDTTGLVRENCSTVERAQSAVFELMSSQNPPTALFATFDHAGLGIVKALNRLALRMPDEVSVITFDGGAWAEAINPNVTSVRQPATQMGSEAVRLLLERIDATEPMSHRRLMLPTEFIVRGSCAPLFS